MSKKKKKIIDFKGTKNAPSIDTFADMNSIDSYVDSLISGSETYEESSDISSMIPKNIMEEIMDEAPKPVEKPTKTTINFGEETPKTKQPEEVKVSEDIEVVDEAQEEIPANSNSVVTGAYPKAVGTADSGYSDYITSVQASTSGSTLSIKLENVNSLLDYGVCVSEKIPDLYERIDGVLDADTAGEISSMCFRKLIASMLPYATTRIGKLKELLKDVSSFNKRKYFMVYYPIPLTEPDDYLVSLYKISEKSWDAYLESIKTLHDFGYPSTMDIIAILKNFTSKVEENSFMINDEDKIKNLEDESRIEEYIKDLKSDSSTKLTKIYNEKFMDLLYNKYSEDFDDYFFDDEEEEINHNDEVDGGVSNDNEPFHGLESNTDAGDGGSESDGTDGDREVEEEEETQEVQDDIGYEEDQADIEEGAEEDEEIDSIEIEEAEDED